MRTIGTQQRMKTLNSTKAAILNIAVCSALITLCTITPLTLHAQTPDVNPPHETATTLRPAATDQTCHRLIDNYLTVIGGKQAYINLKNLVASGTINEAGKLKSFQLIETQDGRRHLTYSWKVSGRPYKTVQAFDGTTTWKQELLPKQTPPVAVKGRDGIHFARQRWLMQPFVIPLKANYSFNYQGKAKVGGRPSYLIVGTGKQSERSWFYFDQQKSLLTRWGGKGTIGGVEAYMDYRATRFAQVNGVLMPKQIDLLAQNAAFGTITFDSINANQPIDTTRFDMPRSFSPTLRQQSGQR